MKLKQLVLYYYYFFLLVSIFSTMAFGYITRNVIQPGLFIHGIMLALLVLYYFKKKTGRRGNKISNMIIGFTIVFLINLFIVEVLQLHIYNVYASLNYAFKIYLLLFLVYFTVNNYEYFQQKVDKILLINTIIILLNIIIGYIFNVGGQSYDRLFEDSYRGFLAGNDTSMFSFVAFGYSLYTLGKSHGWRRYFFLLLLFGSLFSIYIIATKAAFVAGVILLLYLYQKKRNGFIVLLLMLGIIFIAFSMRSDRKSVV